MKWRWKLKSYLSSKGKTSYALSRAMKGKKRTNETILYRIEDGGEVNVNSGTIQEILTGIQRLGFKDVSVKDIIDEVIGDE
jgi:hypothetical protein